MSSDSDDNLSPILTMRLFNKQTFNTPKMPVQLQQKRDVANKLSLTRQKNENKENLDSQLKTPDTASKQKISASFIFSSCKKKQLEVSSCLPGHTILVGDSSDEEEFINGDSFELSTDQNAEAVDESLVEYSLIRKWLQNTEDVSSSDEEVVSDPDICDFIKTGQEIALVVPKTKLTVSSDIVGDDTILLSSDNDEDDSFIFKPKVNASAFKQDIHQSSVKKTSVSSLPDLFDSPLPLDTKSLKEKLKEQSYQQQKSCSSNMPLQDSSSDSECFSPIARPNKKPLAVLCSSSSDEPSSPPKCKPLTVHEEGSTTRNLIPKTKVPESDSELDDMFISLTINKGSSVKPKKFIKTREKKKSQSTAILQSNSRFRRSFLASLSSDVPEEYRHPDATCYLKNFRKHRDELTNRLFLMFNEHIFDNFFDPDFSIKWNARLTKTAGYCRHFTKRENGLISFESKIELSAKVVDTPCRLRDTLVHELCHAATWVIDNCRGGHGPVWRKWANQALDVFPELPQITRCHNYEITYKFYYNCVNCKYSAGRHSKSIDTTTHVCPMCRGKLELSKEPTSKVDANEVPSTPKTKTPRTPNAFALFVKDNYANVKSSRSDLPHALIMRLLSAKFAESKKQIV